MRTDWLLGPEAHVRVPSRYVAYLAAEHLNQLHRAAPDDDAGCAHCCAPCIALAGMAESGMLDEVLQDFGPEFSWWDEDGQKVDRAYLAERIRPYCEGGDMSDPARCTDITDGDGLPQCGELGPRNCREQPECEACRAGRVCTGQPEHGGRHTWLCE